MSTLVTTTAGKVEGRTENNCRIFKGIPYAAPPFGDRRMRAPQPVERWDGVRPAIEPGPSVLKNPYRVPFDQILMEPHIPGEDSLNLNVWTPVDADALPVLVWIHGGAFVNGSGIVPQYDGSAFARDGVVCVTINYRLGADGFLDTGDGETNLGLRDQIAALQWVRQNIAAFGGDPSNVTIAGESAGAMSVTALLSSPLATGLFRRVIAQSGAGHHALERSDAAIIAREIATRLGVEPTREAIAAAPVADLLATQVQLAYDLATQPDPSRWGKAAVNLMAFEPVIDGDVLPALPYEAIRRGAGAGVDVLIGTNSEEYRFFVVPNGLIGMINEPLMALGLAAMGLPLQTAKELYGANGATAGDISAAAMTDWFFRIPAIRLAEAHSANGQQAHMYEFAWRSPLFDGAFGAVHYLEVPFMFDTLGAEGSHAITGPNPPQDLADRMHAAWVRFVKTGDPGWAAYGERRATQRFDVRDEIVEDPHPQSRAAWDGIR